MPKHVNCVECGISLLAFESLGLTPVGHDECPNCGGEEFSFD